MLNQIKGKTINEVVYKSLDKLISEGHRTKSRNGGILSVYNAFITLENPKARHLSLIGRKNNIFATIAETFWVFAGSNKIDPYLSFFLPRASDYSDDGISWRGGYPERISSNEQINDVLQQFRNEGIYTRRAVMVISDPSIDSTSALQEDGIEKGKDRPCNMVLDFFVTPDKKLNMNVKSRSGDIVWGLGSINIFEWTFLQEMILQYIKSEIDPEVTLGVYNHHVTNMHLYDFSGKQGYDVITNKISQENGLLADDEIEFPEIEKIHEFFQGLVSHLSSIITTDTDFSGEEYTGLDDLFERFNVPTTDNLLYLYSNLVLTYILHKKYEEQFSLSTDTVKIKCSDELYHSLENSFFRKFEFVRVER